MSLRFILMTVFAIFLSNHSNIEMKNLIHETLSLSIVTVAAAALAGCAERDFLTDNYNTVIEVSSEAPQCGENSGTRTAVDPTEYTSGEIGVNWLPNDKIGIYGDKGSGNVAFDNMSSSETDRTTFAGNLASGEKPLYAYYPYNPAADSDPHNLTGNLPLVQSYSTATRELKNDWKVGIPYDGSASEYRFRHIFAFLKYDINAAGTEVVGERLLSISLKIDGAQLGGDFSYDFVSDQCSFKPQTDADCVKMEWSDTPELSASTFNGYMNVAPCTGILDKNIDIVITTNRHIIKFSQKSVVDELKTNTYYIIPLELSKFQDEWTIEINPDGEENAAWVPGLESRLACANTVFAIPGKPFMHKIRVPRSSSQTAHAVVPVKTGVKRAYNLPEGLTWNAERCLVEGIAPAAGEYTYSVEFEINGTTYKEGIRLIVSDNLHQPTPHMGWQSWNVLETKIDEASLKAVADALANNGWAKAGYIWLGIDDCWQQLDGLKDANGVALVNSSKFPNGIKAVTDYIHSKGLKAGIYSDAGTLTCASGDQAGGTTLGAYGYESQYAAAFTEWGFDKLKEDWFWGGHGDNNGALNPDDYNLAHELYGKMGSGIKAAGNKILLSMCEWGTHDPWKWAAEVGASSWRMSQDHRDGWMGSLSGSKNNPTKNDGGIGLQNTIDLMRNLWSYTGINRFNDADMLVVGIRGTGSSSNDLVYGVSKNIFGTYKKDGKTYTGMSDAEYETEFAMWCMWSSPLLLTFDVRKSDINSHDVALLKNEELIAINQDQLGQGAEFVKRVGNLEYYMKDLANGDVAIAVVNLGDDQADYTISLTDYDALNAGATYAARNLIKKANAGALSASSSLTGSLASHGTFIVRLVRQ